jgi:hypothetical protein
MMMMIWMVDGVADGVVFVAGLHVARGKASSM